LRERREHYAAGPLLLEHVEKFTFDPSVEE